MQLEEERLANRLSYDYLAQFNHKSSQSGKNPTDYFNKFVEWQQKFTEDHRFDQFYDEYINRIGDIDKI